MLLSFAVENFLSFRNKAILDLQAASIKEHRENVFTSLYSGGYSIVKAAGVFGPNSSGKSNLIKGLSFMRNLILQSNNLKDIPAQYFRLSVNGEKLPTTFEIVFLLNKEKYRYGFAIADKVIGSEWLFVTSKRKEEQIFIRAENNFVFDKKFKAELRGKYELVHEMTAPNALFLTVLAKSNFQFGVEIINWISKIFIVHDRDHVALTSMTAELMSRDDYRKLINDVLRRSDLGIDGVQIRQTESALKTKYSTEFLNFISEAVPEYSIQTGHLKYNDNNKVKEKVFFDLMLNESLGTQKFFGILGPLLQTIKQRGVIVIDEIDASMHSILLNKIVSLFNSEKTNANGAQLVFSSHNTIVLKKGMRRDQMFFTAKNEYGVSSISSLYDMNLKVRNDASYEKDYLTGKYGAIPELGSQLDLFDGL